MDFISASTVLEAYHEPTRRADMNTTAGTSSNATGAGDPNPNKSIKNAILVRRNQKSNPLLKMFQNVAWQYDDILADYEVGRTTGVLFLRWAHLMKWLSSWTSLSLPWGLSHLV